MNLISFLDQYLFTSRCLQSFEVYIMMISWLDDDLNTFSRTIVASTA